MRRRTPTAAAVITALAVEVSNAEGTTAQLAAQLRYDPSDPLAVTLTFIHESGPIPWTFGRDLLVDGLYEPVGDGDVHVWPCLSQAGEAVVMVELASTEGDVLVQLQSRDAVHFVTQTLRSIPRGSEAAQYDLDAGLAALLG